MKPYHPDMNEASTEAIPSFKPWRLIGFVLLLLLGISVWLKWYTGMVSIPRYCANPSQAISYLEKVLTEEHPAPDDNRKPYIIAAKLIYLIPQLSNEPIADYLLRVRTRIAEQCR